MFYFKPELDVSNIFVYENKVVLFHDTFSIIRMVSKEITVYTLVGKETNKELRLEVYDNLIISIKYDNKFIHLSNDIKFIQYV
jgi:hypothetical protein